MILNLITLFIFRFISGQRSLLALSFVLALLKYKPAPFYILDEVDSALDLSHTENIGKSLKYNKILINYLFCFAGFMIAQRFQNSQFMLISLKDGMYQVIINNNSDNIPNYVYFRMLMSSSRLLSSMEFPKLIEFPLKRKSTLTKIKNEKWKSKMKKTYEDLYV